MAEAAGRVVLEVRRRVSDHDLARYDAAWIELRDAAVAASAHAWRFRSRSDPKTYIEFLEFRANTDPRDAPDVVERMDLLESIAPGKSEEFLDASPSTGKEG